MDLIQDKSQYEPIDYDLRREQLIKSHPNNYHTINDVEDLADINHVFWDEFDITVYKINYHYLVAVML